jgi:hypothetical protein
MEESVFKDLRSAHMTLAGTGSEGRIWEATPATLRVVHGGNYLAHWEGMM